jgi:phenylpropionate dioxygenase-like ring-hydroxylating dioxygenase large terminal subunit
MFLKNSWYAAGWRHEFSADKVTPMTITGDHIVLWRDTTGRLHAQADLCPHRLAPLSHGRVEGDTLRCMYHGLRFASDGSCVEIPGQASIPPSICVRTYPLVEKYSVAWVWMGDPAKADESFIPDFQGLDAPDWTYRPGRLTYDANYALINDNLTDLSHIAYVHAASFGGGEASASEEWANAPVMNESLDRGVRVSRWVVNTAGAPFARDMTGPLTDQFVTYDFVVPGIFLLHQHTYSVGAAEKSGMGWPHADLVPAVSQFTCQAVTPFTERSSSYIFAFGPEKKFAEFEPVFAEIGVMAFNEDKVMIEAQQRMIDANPDARMQPLGMDGATNRFRGIMKRLMREEGSLPG